MLWHKPNERFARHPLQQQPRRLMVGEILHQQPCRYFCGHDILFLDELAHRSNLVWTRLVQILLDLVKRVFVKVTSPHDGQQLFDA